MPRQLKTIDANILIDYIMQDRLDRDRKEKIRAFFHPSNDGDITIKIFVYTLGEVFKRLLDQRDGQSIDLSDEQRQKNLKKLQEKVGNGFISIVKMDAISVDFFTHYTSIDRIDYTIQKGDKIALAAFCADTQSKSFYSNDKSVVNSIKVGDYMRNHDPQKSIREL